MIRKFLDSAPDIPFQVEHPLLRLDASCLDPCVPFCIKVFLLLGGLLGKDRRLLREIDGAVHGCDAFVLQGVGNCFWLHLPQWLKRLDGLWRNQRLLALQRLTLILNSRRLRCHVDRGRRGHIGDDRVCAQQYFFWRARLPVSEHLFRFGLLLSLLRPFYCKALPGCCRVSNRLRGSPFRQRLVNLNLLTAIDGIDSHGVPLLRQLFVVRVLRDAPSHIGDCIGPDIGVGMVQVSHDLARRRLAVSCHASAEDCGHEDCRENGVAHCGNAIPASKTFLRTPISLPVCGRHFGPNFKRHVLGRVQQVRLEPRLDDLFKRLGQRLRDQL